MNLIMQMRNCTRNNYNVRHQCIQHYLVYFYSIIMYIDINECETDKNTCHENAVCFNNEGNFRCQCASGFIGDGYNNCSGTYVR